MDTKQELIKRLQDYTISSVAKASIVEELKNLGAEVLECVYVGPKPEGFRQDFEVGETYVVLRHTMTTVHVWSGITDTKFIKNRDGDYLESGWRNEYNRSVLVPVKGDDV